MVFSSLLFVFAFLPICYGIYALMPGIRSRNLVLFVFSLVFYAFGGPALVLLLAGMTLICYLGGRLIERYRARARSILVLTLVLCLGILGFFKYTGFFLANMQAIFGVPEVVPSITLPIGISFYTFQLLSYVIDVYRGEIVAQKKYWLLLLYAALFHQCIAGPIVRYRDVNEELEHRCVTREDLAGGVTRFAVGLAKKALLANGCAAIVSALVEGKDLRTVSAAGILLAGLAFMLEIYLDFSAYSDMAIGMGRMIGIHYLENFKYPYIAHSVTDFWRRWHISLSSFFRDYVYIPLGGNRVGGLRHVFNLFVVWTLTGLWHGASWNFVLWGVYYFVFLVLEKFVLRLKRESHGAVRILRTAYTLIVVYFGWLLFYYTDLSALLVALGGIFTLNGNAFVDVAARTQLFNNLFFLAVAICACTPVVRTVSSFFEERRKNVAAAAHGEKILRVSLTVYDAVCAMLPAVLVMLSLLALVGDSYNPFLYFQF